MRVPDPKLQLNFPARTFIIDGAVDHQVLPFVQALQEQKFRVTSTPGHSPITLRYGKFWKWLTWEGGPVAALILPEKWQRWELQIDVLIAVRLMFMGTMR